MTQTTATGRRKRSDGARSRAAILAAAGKLATVDGLDGLTIGRLADHIGMSKSGLYAHFGSKQELQLATVAAAEDVFDDDVLRPAREVPAGLPASTPTARPSCPTCSAPSSPAAASSPR